MKQTVNEQRYIISVMFGMSYKQKQIAEVIGKDKSTISKELHRGQYRHELAQHK